MQANTTRRQKVGILGLALGLASASILTFAATPEANASAVIPINVGGEWFKVQSAWLEQCSATMYLQTDAGPTWPSKLRGDYTKVVRGVTTHLRPADNGGNDGDFFWKCGTSHEHSDAPGNGFNLLRVTHSNTSREISLMALDLCGNGTSVDQCF